MVLASALEVETLFCAGCKEWVAGVGVSADAGADAGADADAGVASTVTAASVSVSAQHGAVVMPHKRMPKIGKILRNIEFPQSALV